MNKKTVIACVFLLVLFVVGAVCLINKKADAPQSSSTNEEKRKEEVLNCILNDEKTIKMLEEQGIDPDSVYLDDGKYIKIN